MEELESMLDLYTSGWGSIASFRIRSWIFWFLKRGLE